MGTPELARTCLAALQKSDAVELVAVVTQPDRPKGRDLKLQPTPVKELAMSSRLPVLQPERARSDDFFQQLAQFQPELIVVAAYGQILPQRILDLPRLGCLNVHTSLLPKYRGAAPIQWAILNGDRETGVTIMKMDAGMDTGPMVAIERTTISDCDDSQTLHDRLAIMGGELMTRTIPDYAAGRLATRAQPAEGISYAAKIKKKDGRLDWSKPAVELWNRVRGLVPWPGAFTYLGGEGAGTLLKIWNAVPMETPGPSGEIVKAGAEGILVGCGKGSLKITTVQLEGGKRLSAQQFLAGHPLPNGTRLG